MTTEGCGNRRPLPGQSRVPEDGLVWSRSAHHGCVWKGAVQGQCQGQCQPSPGSSSDPGSLHPRSLSHPGFCHRSKSSYRPERGRLPCPPASAVSGNGLKDIADGPGDLPPVSSPHPGRILGGRQRRMLGNEDSSIQEDCVVPHQDGGDEPGVASLSDALESELHHSLAGSL